MRENFFNNLYRICVHRRHAELRASANPSLNDLRHEILRLDGLNLTCEKVGELLLQPMLAGRRGNTGKGESGAVATRKAARASQQAEQGGDDLKAHASAAEAHDAAARIHREAAEYHCEQADYHSKKANADDADAAETQPAEIDCARSLPSLLGDATVPEAIMFMPAGIHTITPSRAGKPVTLTVLVNPTTATRIENQRQALEANVGKPFFSIEHGSQVAAFWPTKFFWATRRDVTGAMVSGVWVEGEWTNAGREAVEGKNFRTFSPTFFVNAIRNDPDNPSEIICNEDANLNMGAVVNDPAFQSISPLWSTTRAAA